MNADSETIEKFTQIFGFGYAHIFSEVTESVRQMHISKEQMAIIEYLFMHKSATPTELSEKLGVHNSSIAHALRKLSTKKLIYSKKNPLNNDKRSKLISLTEKAQEIISEVFTHLSKIICQKLGPLSQKDTQALNEAADTIIKIFKIDGGLFNEAGA